VIVSIGSYDITTVRASVGQFLLSKKIRETTDIKVLLLGDGSDEVSNGYMYNHKCPSPEEGHEDSLRLLREISYFDVLRADSGVACNSLEARCPYLQADYVVNYLSIDPKLRLPVDKKEKWLLRKSFEGLDYLPEKVLWRPKEAFSDGVSSKSKSWYVIIQENLEEKYGNKDFEFLRLKYKYNSPPSKEALYYREIFEKKYGDLKSKVIPHFWLPKWCGDIKEPSARVLDVY